MKRYNIKDYMTSKDKKAGVAYLRSGGGNLYKLLYEKIRTGRMVIGEFYSLVRYWDLEDGSKQTYVAKCVSADYALELILTRDLEKCTEEEALIERICAI